MRSMNLDYIKNAVEHDDIRIGGTINFPQRYKFYNDIRQLIQTKVSMAKTMRQRGLIGAPIISIALDCPDTTPCLSQTKDLFKMLSFARDNGVIIETICMGEQVAGWSAWLAVNMGTPMFRKMYENSTLLYGEHKRDPHSGRIMNVWQQVATIPAHMCLKLNLCDQILLSNGKILTR